MSEQVAAVRRFNRRLTQRVGVLQDSFLGRGRPLGEARLLYEIGRRGADLTRLRLSLELDSGYLSRLLRSLERQGLVRIAFAPGDARRRAVVLTAKGLREFAEYDRCSDDFAQSILDPLSESQRARLLSAMSDVDRLMRVSSIHIEAEPAGSPDAVRCLAEYYAELNRRFEGGYDPGRGLSPSAEEMTPPLGLFLVARCMGEAVGCGALRLMAGRVGLVKRMWVHESMRGLRLGSRILGRLEEEARRLGLKKLQLDTNKALTEAHALYRRNGYREVAAFSEEPYAHHWFEKHLRTPRPPASQRDGVKVRRSKILPGRAAAADE